METLETAVTYSPEHLSCYELTIEENTPFASEFQKGFFALPGEETQREFFIRTSEFLEVRGYIHYEVSTARGGISLPAQSEILGSHPYLGFGPAAHSFTAPAVGNHRSVENISSRWKRVPFPSNLSKI
jgi:oxygen-independent coproporphyrinogen-3 oxidase